MTDTDIDPLDLAAQNRCSWRIDILVNDGGVNPGVFEAKEPDPLLLSGVRRGPDLPAPLVA